MQLVGTDGGDALRLPTFKGAVLGLNHGDVFSPALILRTTFRTFSDEDSNAVMNVASESQPLAPSILWLWRPRAGAGLATSTAGGGTSTATGPTCWDMGRLDPVLQERCCRDLVVRLGGNGARHDWESVPPLHAPPAQFQLDEIGRVRRAKRDVGRARQRPRRERSERDVVGTDLAGVEEGIR